MKNKIIIHKWGREITLYGSAIDRYAEKIMRSRRFLNNLRDNLDYVAEQLEIETARDMVLAGELDKVEFAKEIKI